MSKFTMIVTISKLQWVSYNESYNALLQWASYSRKPKIEVSIITAWPVIAVLVGWLFGRFYGITTFVGVFHVEVSLFFNNYMVSGNYYNVIVISKEL